MNFVIVTSKTVPRIRKTFNKSDWIKRLGVQSFMIGPVDYAPLYNGQLSITYVPFML